MQVLKFGGTSMGDEDTWRNVLGIISNYDRPVVIVSATSRTTRQLIAAAEEAVHNLEKATSLADDIAKRHRDLIGNFISHQNGAEKKLTEITQQCNRWITVCLDSLHTDLEKIFQENHLSPCRKDAVASMGEQLSSKLLVNCAKALGLPADWIDARKVIKTDSNYGNAQPKLDQLDKAVKYINKSVTKGNLPIMGGYYGESPEGTITTLGFEGSDFSASLVGAALNAETVEIWTDVSGVYTCDPRVVDKAESIPELSYREAHDLAFFGAKVLHPDTMRPAQKKGITIFVKNIFTPGHPGTKINATSSNNGYAKAMAILNNISVLNIATSPKQETAVKSKSIADIFDKHEVPIIARATSSNTIKAALKQRLVTDSLISSLNEAGSTQQIREQAVISLIGCKPEIEHAEWLKNMVLEGVTSHEPAMVSFTDDKTILNIALPQCNIDTAVNAIHQKVFEGEKTKNKTGTPT